MKIEAWETEDYLVVFGTHDLVNAFEVALGFYEKHGLDQPEDFLTDLWSTLEHGGARWADPAVVDFEDERPWPKEMISSEAIEGWIPFFSVMW